ncbi:NAD(P)-binding protein [Violaceomyces palustris]|uniref:NAD(P)-binding protein n=1 Tax=Violaceomyces palustris TaxID=1673888 RepID=A0ACD0NPI0_9BASI|nr:NAD(P)-binding protein [Violaceomyces palustris]
MSISTNQPLRFLITGAARGLARGLSASLIQRGHDCYLIDNNAEELRNTLEVYLPSLRPIQPCQQLGRFQGLVCDVSSPDQVQSAVQKAAIWSRSGRFDVLINNAARTNPYWSQGKTLEEVDPQEWRSFVDVNLSGCFYVSRASLPYLKRAKREAGEPDACIINISSTRSRQSEPNQEGYAATKAGILGLTHSMASSLSTPEYRVRVNSILPGWIPSSHESIQGDRLGSKWDDGLSEADHEQHWSGRVGKVEDLYNTVIYLCQTGFINGQEVVIDGGMTKKMIYVE